MAWVSPKVYAILKGAQKRGNSNADFVDKIKEMSEGDVEKALDAFFKNGGLQKQEFEEIYAELESQDNPPLQEGEEPGKKTSKKSKIKFNDRQARKLAKLDEGLGSVNTVLGITEPVTKEKVEKIVKDLKLDEDGQIATAMREFSRPFNNPELATAREVKITLPNGKKVKVAFYNMGSEEKNTQRKQDGERWKMEVKTEQEKALEQSGGVQYGNEAFIVVGLPGAGKSVTAAGKIINKYGAYEIDSDIFKDKMPESKEQAPDGHMVNNSSIVHYESGILRDDFEDMLTSQAKDGKLPNLVLPTVGGDINSLMERVNRLKQKGYKVNLINAFANTEVAMERNRSRFKQKLAKGQPVRYVGAEEYASSSVDKINSVFQTVLETQGNKIAKWAIYDGNRPMPAKPLFVDGSDDWDNFFGDEE